MIAVFSAAFFDLQVNFLFLSGFLASAGSIWTYYGGQTEVVESGKPSPISIARMFYRSAHNPSDVGDEDENEGIAMVPIRLGGSERGTGLVDQGVNAVENVANRLRRERSARRLGRNGSRGAISYSYLIDFRLCFD